MGLRPLHRALLVVSLGALASLVALSLMPAGSHALPVDTTLSGTVTNTTLELWGDLYIPAGETLELANCTVLFHCEYGAYFSIRGGDGSGLIIRDLDGNPATRGDMTSISSTELPWSMFCTNGSVLEVRCSELVGLGNTWAHGSDGVRLLDSYIHCVGGEVRFDTDATFEVNGCSLNGTGGFVMVMGRNVKVRNSHVKGASGDFYATGTVDTLVTDCYFTGGRRALGVGGGAAWVEYCTFNGSFIGVDITSAHAEVRGCAFIDCVRGVDEGSQSLLIEDCSFTSGGMDSYGVSSNSNVVELRDCSFEGLYRAVSSVSNPGLLNISACQFEVCDVCVFSFSRSTVRIDGSDLRGSIIGVNCSYLARLDVLDSSFTDVETAISMASVDSMRVADTVFTNGLYGAVVSSGAVGAVFQTIDIARCSFKNISEAAIWSLFGAGTKRTMRIEDCTFEDSARCVNQTVDGMIGASVKLNTTIVRSVFKGLGTAFEGWPGLLTIEDSTFDGADAGSGANGTGLDLLLIQPVACELHVRQDAFSNCSLGIGFYAGGSRPTAVIEILDTVFEDCTRGIVGCSNGTVALDRVAFARCGLALNVTKTTTVDIRNTTVRDCGDGLELFWCYRAYLRDVVGSHVTGWFVEMSDLVTAAWEMTRPANITDVRIKLFGAFDLRADVELYEVELLVDGTNSDWSDVLVREGVRLGVIRSRLHCTAHGSYGLFAEAGSTLEVRESNVSGMRWSSSRPILVGPWVEGGTVRYIDSVFRDCFRCLTVINGTAEVLRSSLVGEERGILAKSSNVTVEGSIISGGGTGLRMTSGTLTVRSSMILGALGSVDAEGSNVIMSEGTLALDAGASMLGRADVVGLRLTGCTAKLEHIRVQGWAVVALLSGGTVELWECDLNPGSVAEVRMDCACRLYTTSWDGTWYVSGQASSVEIYFSHTVTARYHWSMEPAAGMEVVITPALEGSDTLRLALGPFGRYVGLWIMQRQILERQVLELAPYTFTIELPGLWGESASPCDAPMDVTLLVRDIAAPEVHIMGPADGSLHATGTVRVWGTIEELGSGLDAFMYCVGSGDWVPVPAGGENWEVNVHLGDGRQVVSVRALDLDGNQGLNYTSVIVDTAPPELAFLSPAGGSSFNATSVGLRGSASAKGGTALAGVTLDGAPVSMETSGEFSLEAPLSKEGPHTFVLLAVDAAGNRATATLVLIRDTVPPELLLDGCPNETNEPELVLTGHCRDGSVTVNGREAFQAFDGTFTMSMSLVEGVNQIEVVASDEAGNTARALVWVHLDTIARGTILSPVEGAIIRGDALALVLSTEPHAIAMVIGRTDWTAANGTGDLVLELDGLLEGSLRFTVSFRDRMGNEAVRTVNVTLVGSEPTTSGMDWGVVVMVLVVVAAVVATAMLVRRRRRRGARVSLPGPAPDAHSFQ